MHGATDLTVPVARSYTGGFALNAALGGATHVTGGLPALPSDLVNTGLPDMSPPVPACRQRCPCDMA